MLCGGVQPAKQFALTQQHLEQSYSIASKYSDFDTYQIDNVWALLLLKREIEEPNPERSLRVFLDASKIINRHLAERKHGYYPYRVAKEYGDFWSHVAKQWEPEQRSIFLKACTTVLNFLDRVDSDLEEVDHVRQYRTVVLDVLRDANYTVTG